MLKEYENKLSANEILHQESLHSLQIENNFMRNLLVALGVSQEIPSEAFHDNLIEQSSAISLQVRLVGIHFFKY